MDDQEPQERWASKHFWDTLEAWKKERDQWLERAFKFGIGLNAGGVAAGLALVSARIEAGIHGFTIAGLLFFLAGLAIAATMPIAKFYTAARKVEHYENLAEEAWGGGAALPISILIDQRQPSPSDSVFYQPLKKYLYWTVGCFVMGVIDLAMAYFKIVKIL